MIKHDFSIGKDHILCDRSRIIIIYNEDENRNSYFANAKSKNKKIHMDFCGFKCRDIFFKGKKYWARKLENMLRGKNVTQS